MYPTGTLRSINHHLPQFRSERCRFFFAEKSHKVQLSPARIYLGSGAASLLRFGEEEIGCHFDDDFIFEAEDLSEALFDPVGEDGAVELGDFDFGGEVRGEGGGAEELGEGGSGGDGGCSFDGRHGFWVSELEDEIEERS